MAFFPRNYYNSSNAGFQPLFRFLEDFDNYQQGEEQTTRTKGCSKSATLTFQPKFDVRELEDRFELHGELPGMNKDKISIEFTDPNTLRIHGSVERAYTSGTPPAALLQDKDTEMSGAIADGEASDGEKSNKSYQATVEDEDAEWTDTNPAVATPTSTAASQAEKKRKTDARQKKQQQKPKDTAKFWCSERSIGEFSRSFNFPGQIQQEAVSASLTDGILNVQVPKAPKHEARRIAIV